MMGLSEKHFPCVPRRLVAWVSEPMLMCQDQIITFSESMVEDIVDQAQSLKRKAEHRVWKKAEMWVEYGDCETIEEAIEIAQAGGNPHGHSLLPGRSRRTH